MEGDSSPHLLFPAVLQAASMLDLSHQFLVIVTKDVAEKLSERLNAPENVKVRPSIAFHVVADTIAMEDDPLGAVRRKKGSSIVVGMRLLKKRRIDAFVSCGNTGALIASAALSLPKLPGIKRPALLAALPAERGSVAVIDVGGNVYCKARHLIQFAYLGAAYQRAVNDIPVPTIGLLNVGIESKKGTQELREVYEFLEAHCQPKLGETAFGMKFVGNMEGRDVFKGEVDVLVTDGFTGNVLLKTAEGAASFIFSSLIETLKDNLSVDLKQVLSELQKQFNYAEYPGAIVCGVEGIVIKAHGSASAGALLNSILGAVNYVQRGIISLIKTHLESLHT